MSVLEDNAGATFSYLLLVLGLTVVLHESGIKCKRSVMCNGALLANPNDNYMRGQHVNCIWDTCYCKKSHG